MTSERDNGNKWERDVLLIADAEKTAHICRLEHALGVLWDSVKNDSHWRHNHPVIVRVLERVMSEQRASNERAHN